MDLVAVYFNDFQQTAFVQEGGTVAQAADNAHFVGNDDDGYVETSVDVFQTLQTLRVVAGSRAEVGSSARMT